MSKQTVSATLTQATATANVQRVNLNANVHRGIVEGGGIPYTGEYEVTPTFDEQTLETKDRLLSDNVTVHSIPVSRTINPQGGKTIYIGEVM